MDRAAYIPSHERKRLLTEMNKSLQVQPAPEINAAILTIRDQKVLLDADLALIYGVPTKALNQAIKRNLGRFPAAIVVSHPCAAETSELEQAIKEILRRLDHA